MPARKKAQAACRRPNRKCRVNQVMTCAQRYTQVCDSEVAKTIDSVRYLVPLVRIVRFDALIGGGSALGDSFVQPAVRRAVLAHYLLPKVDARAGRSAPDDRRLAATKEIYGEQKLKLKVHMWALLLVLQPANLEARTGLEIALETLATSGRSVAVRPFANMTQKVRGEPCGKYTRKCAYKGNPSQCVDKRWPCAPQVQKAKDAVRGLRELARAFQFAIDVNDTIDLAQPDTTAHRAVVMSKARKSVNRKVSSGADAATRYSAFMALDNANHSQNWIYRDEYALAAAAAKPGSAQKLNHEANLRIVIVAMRESRRREKAAAYAAARAP